MQLRIHCQTSTVLQVIYRTDIRRCYYLFMLVLKLIHVWQKAPVNKFDFQFKHILPSLDKVGWGGGGGWGWGWGGVGGGGGGGCHLLLAYVISILYQTKSETICTLLGFDDSSFVTRLGFPPLSDVDYN